MRCIAFVLPLLMTTITAIAENHLARSHEANVLQPPHDYAARLQNDAQHSQHHSRQPPKAELLDASKFRSYVAQLLAQEHASASHLHQVSKLKLLGV